MKHSDLAVESAHIPAGTSGTRCVSRTIGGVKITDIRISNSAVRTISRRPGRYITLEGDPAGNALPALLKRALEQLLPPTGRILAAGLGNPDITRDRLADRPAAVREVWKALLPRRDRNRRCAAHRNRNRRTGPLRRPGDGSLCDHRRGFPLLRRPREAVPHRSAHRRRYNAGIRGGGSAQWAFRTLRRDPRNSCRSTLRRASQQHYRRSGASAVSCRAV